MIPSHGTRSAERKQHQNKRWFRRAQKWRTGSECRISLLKRRQGLDRCRYKGTDGMKRWVGLGAITENLINIALAPLEATVRPTTAPSFAPESS